MAKKNFRVGILLNKNLLGLGNRKQTTFSFRPRIFSLLNGHVMSSTRLFFNDSDMYPR